MPETRRAQTATITDPSARFAWDDIGAQLDAEGYALLPALFDNAQTLALAALATGAENCHPLVPGAAEFVGGAEFPLPQVLPAVVAEWRESLYRRLVPVANRWRDHLEPAPEYPAQLGAFLQQNRRAGQSRPQSAINLLRRDDYQALHQHTDGVHIFPLQLVALLSEPDRDFSGGELVLTEQRPRLQSRPLVLPLRRGDAALIAVAQRPHKGSNGYYRVNLKHAISRVRSGTRIGLELLFHDAPEHQR